ncbi:MAG: polysaccharide pyruvyl transferase family protein [Ruminococcus sp.]|nr:polysaccharide pyruvyl transferase family protein [Ruminococcus sp.]
MKRICVVTWYNSTNYGTQLQATSLCKYFEECGYKTYVLKNFRVKEYVLKHPRLLKTRVMAKLNNKKTKKFFNPVTYDITDERKKRIEGYVAETFHPLSINSMGMWKRIIRDKVIFVSGSDIIWQPALGAPGRFFLDFAMYEDLKRFSYASSTGAKELPKKYYSDYKRVMSGFSAISVREQNTADFFSGLLGREVEKVIDPTLLHDTVFWDKIAKKANPDDIPEKKFILCYFVMEDNRYWDYVKLAREKCGEYEIVVLPMHKSDERSEYRIVTDGTPCEFLSLIKKSEFIVTDSFHAAVFSFLYEKEFYVLKRARSDEDEKFNDLVNKYYLKSRVITNEKIFERNTDTDYSAGLLTLEEDRKKAKAYLLQAVNSGQ